MSLRKLTDDFGQEAVKKLIAAFYDAVNRPQAICPICLHDIVLNEICEETDDHTKKSWSCTNCSTLTYTYEFHNEEDN